MSEYEDEKARQNKAFYLHEAGHAVLGRHFGFTINEVRCDGADENYVDRSLPPAFAEDAKALKAADGDKTVPADRFLAMALEVYESQLVVLMGGLAGESLELGRPLTSIARGADDLAQIILMISSMLARFDMAGRHARLIEVFRSTSEKANELAQSLRKEIVAVADALQVKHRLSGDEVEMIIAQANR